MADAYNVRSNGQRYYVYRIDGNVQVAEYFNGSEAQIDAARRNQRWNEQMGKKKEVVTEPAPTAAGFVEQQLKPEQGIGKGHVPNPPPGQGISY